MLKNKISQTNYKYWPLKPKNKNQQNEIYYLETKINK